MINMKYVLVPLMLTVSSMFMALAWIGHLKFKQLPLVPAVLACWILVLPEYILNVTAIRYGHPTFSGAAMATFNLCSGVLCVALVSVFVLKERLLPHQMVGFLLLAIGMALIAWKSTDPASNGGADSKETHVRGGQT